MSYRYERYRERPRNRFRSCLISLTIFVWVLVLGCLGTRFLVRPAVTDYVSREIADSINPQLPANLDPNEALRESLEQVPIGGAVVPGELRVTDEQANEYVAAYRDRLVGIDDLRVRFVPGELQADVTVQGLTNTAHAQAAVQDGRIVAQNARLDQPLGSLLSIEPLLDAILGRLNAELAAQQRRVTDVRIEQGVAIMTVE